MDGILPLDLTAFEEYMLADDRPSHPMSFFVRLKIGGSLAPARVKAGFAAIALQHPLLRAVVERRGRSWHRWVPATHAASVEFGRPLNALGCPTARALDLRHEPGVRLYAHLHPEASQLLFHFHHACTDGMGALLAIEDFFRAYAYDGPLTPFEATGDFERLRKLRRRGGYGLGIRDLPRLLVGQLLGLEGARQFLLRKPRPLDPSCKDTRELPWNGNLEMRSLTIADERLEPLRQRARDFQITLYELIMAAVLLAIRDTGITIQNREGERSAAKPDAWLRLNIPINLRRDSHQGLSAANIVSMMFVDRRPSQMANSRQLLRGLHREMGWKKRWGLGYTFPFGAILFRRIPGLMPTMSRWRRCLATMVLSNLGEPFAETDLPRTNGRLCLGDALLEEIDVAATTRHLTSASLAVNRYAGRLRLTLNSDPRECSARAAETLLDRIEYWLWHVAG